MNTCYCLIVISFGFLLVDSDAQRNRNPWERIKRYDADNDGIVTKTEFKGPAHMIERFDKNGDGELTKEEVDRARGPGAKKDNAPKVGDPIPDVSAKRAGVDEVIKISKPTRTTVLVFGSFT